MTEHITNIVVIGAPRSGTTLLSGQLSGGDHAFPMLPECSFVTRLIRHYHDIINYSDAPRFSAYAISESKLQRIYQDAVAGFIANARSHYLGMPYRYLILKDPELTLLADKIPTFFGENCKCVCIVRDPRAVISSMIKVVRRKRADAWKNLRSCLSRHAVLNVISSFIDERRLVSKVLGYYHALHTSTLYKSGRIHVVRFEEITAQDEAEFARLEDFLGFKVGRGGFTKIGFDFDRNDPTFSENYGKSICRVQSDFREIQSTRALRKIERLFSVYNSDYHWW